MNELEKRTFASLAQSGDGEVIRQYLIRIADEMATKVIENRDTTLDELHGVRLAHGQLKDLADRFIGRDTIKSDAERLD